MSLHLHAPSVTFKINASNLWHYRERFTLGGERLIISFHQNHWWETKRVSTCVNTTVFFSSEVFNVLFLYIIERYGYLGLASKLMLTLTLKWNVIFKYNQISFIINFNSSF